MYELVTDSDLNVLEPSTISYPNVNFYSSDGRQLEDGKCERLIKLLTSILENSKKDLETWKGSLGSYVVKKYDEALGKENFADIDSETSYQLLDYFHKFENSIEASGEYLHFHLILILKQMNFFGKIFRYLV